MNSRLINKLFLALTGLVLLSSCAKKLDVFPENEFTEEQAFSSPEGYKSVLAKVYGAMATTGNAGPAGASDIQGLDEGSQSPFIRGLFNIQELPTDEAVVSWDDQTIKDFHGLRFTTSDPFLYGFYSRLAYNVALCNEYLRQSSDDKLSGRGISGAAADEIRATRSEVRWLRAYNYWVAMDVFGKFTFTQETDLVGSGLPREITRANLFAYVETELLALQDVMAPAKSIEYGRVDRAAAWALLSRLYLNAQVYTGTARWTDAMTYAEKVINAGYVLYPNYPGMFLADNDKAKNEFIYTINCDGARTQSYGNTSFMVHAASGDDASAEYGVGAGWAGYRVTKQFVNLFPDPSGNSDKRALFTNLANPDINDLGQFMQGVHSKKWRNVRSDGGAVSDAQSRNFADNDFPVFRLAEMYLNYAEAAARSGTNTATALNYLNLVRRRAFGNSSSDYSGLPSLTEILDERGRELHWEAQRRTDLVRYNLLTTGTYLWQWKGGSQTGAAVDPKYNVFPIPQQVRTANPGLSQNTGY